MPLVLLLWMGACLQSIAQPKLDFTIKKPPQFQERKLGSEKNADKNFHIVRRFWQNTYTHYNYYFNANNLVKDIIEQAKTASPDDFTELLKYYPWSLENTSKSTDIDSILYKVTAGILLHDLRNDWIDNMYLLMGKAYYLRKDFDSATMAFQYLNFSYAPKAKDGSDKKIGSNANSGTNAFTIMSKERKAYILSQPPSRNDGFVWAIRNLTDKGNYLDASSLISILRNDPNFPKRLEPELSEAEGYLFYKLSMWDSAATYLEKAMPLAQGPDDKARRWYLTGQLYQLGGNNQKAGEAFANCSNSATDLVMDVYARLSSIRLRKNDNPNILQENIDDLVAMAKRDKYLDYRDIIYYAAAMVELERNGYDAAAGYLTKSVESNTNNAKQKTLSLLTLGDTRYLQKKYGKAAGPYDSLSVSLLKEPEAERVKVRKPGCLQVFGAENVIYLQDSLIRLADMPEEERSAMVRKLSNQLRKKMGLTEELTNTGTVSSGGLSTDKENTGLFVSTGSTWYFYDPNIRASGFNNFKERWGGRPNEDNWRRSSALSMMAARGNEPEIKGGDPDGFGTDPAAIEEVFDSTDISYDNLYSRIPLSAERRLKAENLLIAALFSKALALHEKIEDYPEAIKVYEEILKRRDTGAIVQKTLFNLVHCYTKVGDTRNAQLARERLARDFKEETEAIAAQTKMESGSESVENEAYQNIYSLFLEGNFKKALSEKQKADSVLGESYWKPQLLYIQSVYFIKEREDSLALAELYNITTRFSEHPLAQKARVMIDVLKRRKDIEDYLTKLEITRAKEDEIDPELSRPTPAVIAVVPNPQPAVAKDSSKQKETADLLAKQQAEEKAKQEKLKQEAEAKAEAQRKAEEAEALKKAEAEKIAAEKALAEKQKAEKLAAEKALADQLAAEKAKAEKELADKIAAEKAKADKELADKLAADKAKAEKELADKQKAEREALEKDATNKAEAEKALAEKQAREKAAMEKALAEKQAAEKAKADKELAGKLAAEKLAADKLLAEKQAADKLAADKLLAEKQAADKARADSVANAKLEANRIAAEQARLAREAEAKARAGAVDGVMVGTPATPSPFTIRANERQVVAIVLEKIDPAYVNEVSYALSNTERRNTENAEVSVVKKKIRDGLWLVELHSASFVNMQSSYDYIKYISPVTRTELITWLDASKYYFVTISEQNLKEIEKSASIQLYRKVLQEAVPGKF